MGRLNHGMGGHYYFVNYFLIIINNNNNNNLISTTPPPSKNKQTKKHDHIPRPKQAYEFISFVQLKTQYQIKESIIKKVIKWPARFCLRLIYNEVLVVVVVII